VTASAAGGKPRSRLPAVGRPAATLLRPRSAGALLGPILPMVGKSRRQETPAADVRIAADPDVLTAATEQNDRMSGRRRVDVVAVAGAMLTVMSAVVYIWLIRDQGDQPLAWVLGVMLCGAALAGYGARITSPQRRTALLFAGVLLTGLGVLALLSIGAPIIAAGVLCLISGARTRPVGGT